MEYYGLLKSERVDDFVELILCANTIPPERKKFLELNGIECKEVGIDLINQVAEKFNYAFIQEIEKQINPVEQTIRQKENANQKEIIERKDKSVEEHLENASQEIKNLFYTINEKVLALSFEIKRHTTGANILYKTSVNFVELGIQKQGLKLLLRTKKNEINDLKRLTRQVPKSHLWGKMTHTLFLKPNELNIKYTIVDVIDLINQSLKATY